MAHDNEQSRSSGGADALTAKLQAGQVDAIISRLECLRTLPAVASGLLKAVTQAGEDDAAARHRLVCLAGRDPALSARLLWAANRASSRRLGTVAEAVEAIGVSAARAAALSVKVFDAGQAPLAVGPLEMPAFWHHCLAVAHGSQMLAALLGLDISPDEAFLCGLLHDLGKLALAECLPKSFARAFESARAHGESINQHERKIIGVDHCLFGRRLAEHWRLPEAVCNVIWLHHQPAEAMGASLPGCDIILAVGLADAIARGRQIGSSGNFAPPEPAGAAERLGLGEQTVADVAEKLPAMVERSAGLLGLAAVDGRRLYEQALADASAALARLNEELARRAEKLGGQAKAFRHMEDFIASLRPDAVIGEILAGIARVMCAAMDSPASPERPVVAYSICQDDKTVLAVRWDGAERLFWRSLALADGFDAAADEAPQPARAVIDKFLLDAGDLDEWLDAGACEHQPLICAGRWIGGVFHAALGPAAAERLEVCRAVASAASLALGIAQSRAKAMLLSEQLAGSAQIVAETQEVLAEARGMAAVGQMASGAAHELNTPLAVISGRAQVMRDRAVGQEERKVWQLIFEQAHRISNVLSELMEFAGPQPVPPEKLAVAQLLAEAAEAFSSGGHPQAGAVRVDISTDAGVPPAFAGRSQIRSALLELLKNAAAATGEGGAVRLTAEYDELSDAVVIKVIDSGAGMDEQTIADAFTPFFSSQQAGRRLGMGLPKARRYVEMNGGSIRLQSRPGEGTTAIVQLPPAGRTRKEGGR